jgi:hypothetical protein
VHSFPDSAREREQEGVESDQLCDQEDDCERVVEVCHCGDVDGLGSTKRKLHVI